MSVNALSTNLLSASLFDIAYSLDAATNDTSTMCWLFKFCAIALSEHGLDVHELVPEEDDDSEETSMMFRRAGAIISHIEARRMFDQSSMQPLSDTEILVRSIRNLLAMQVRYAERDVRSPRRTRWERS